MSAHHAIVALGLMAAACGSSKPHALSANEEAALLDIDDADDVGESSASRRDPGVNLTARTNCYFGDLIVARSGEAREKQGALLVKLTLDPSSARMVEETWSFPLYERYVVTRSIDLDGNAFAMNKDDGAFSGHGELHGAPWMWQGWTTTSASADAKVRVQSDTAYDDGLLVTKERVTDAAGALIASVSHRLKEVPLDECAKMFRKAQSVAEQRISSRASIQTD